MSKPVRLGSTEDWWCPGWGSVCTAKNPITLVHWVSRCLLHCESLQAGATWYPIYVLSYPASTGTLCCRISRCPTNAWVNFEISFCLFKCLFPSFMVLITCGCQISECWGEYERACLEQRFSPEHFPIHDLTWILATALWSTWRKCY